MEKIDDAMNRSLVLNLYVAVCLLQGCGMSFFVPPEEDAVVDEHVYFSPIEDSGVRALSTKIERRLVLMNRQPDPKKEGEYWFTVRRTSCRSHTVLEQPLQNVGGNPGEWC